MLQTPVPGAAAPEQVEIHTTRHGLQRSAGPPLHQESRKKSADAGNRPQADASADSALLHGVTRPF